MVESINHKADLVVKGTSFSGFNEYGQIMVGDMGFEFFADRNPRRCVQIPWSEVDYVIASVLFKGKWIPRIGVKTHKDGTFMFAAKEPKHLLRVCRDYLGEDKMYRSWSFLDVVKRNIKRHTHKDAKK